jgi:hypothetical protein
MTARQSSRDVNAKEAIECIRSAMTNAEVMKRFKISAAGYAHLLKQLFALKLISQHDLERRGIHFRILNPPESEKPVERAPLRRLGALDEDNEFLDTVELTELLSFKPKERQDPEKHPEPVGESTQTREPAGAGKAKKAKPGMSVLFRKAW